MKLFPIIDRAVSNLMRTLSALRGKRIFHPHGRAFTGTLTITTPRPEIAGASLFKTAASYPVILRFSRATGFPQPLPDILGISLRVPDRYGDGKHQDLLFISSGNGILIHHLLLFTRGHLKLSFSTLLFFRVGSLKCLLGLVPHRISASSRLTELGYLAQAGRLKYDVAFATPLGRWQTIGTVEALEELPQVESELLRFNPWNTGGGILPLGFLNRLRKNAYIASQEGRLMSKSSDK